MYTLIAYKPNSTEYSMGCRVGSYQAELITTTHATKESLIEAWRAICIRNTHREWDEENFEIQIYQNGELVWDQISDYGYVREEKPEKPDFLVAADWLEEHGFNPEVITHLRKYGNGFTREGLTDLHPDAEELYKIRDQLQQEHPRREGR
jgi:hypothetical protein